MKSIWLINGSGDEGTWETEAFDSEEKAKEHMKEYVIEFKTNYPDSEWDIDDDYTFARFDNDNHYETFWIERVDVQ